MEDRNKMLRTACAAVIADAEKAISSHFTMKYISDYSGLSYSSVMDIRHKRRHLENAAFSTVSALAQFYYDHQKVIEKMAKNKKTGSLSKTKEEK